MGVACEPAIKWQGGSEELIYVEQAQWSQSDLAAIEEDCKRLDMFQERMKVWHWHDDEYPQAQMLPHARRTLYGAEVSHAGVCQHPSESWKTIKAPCGTATSRLTDLWYDL